jgi:hypothetical protein
LAISFIQSFVFLLLIFKRFCYIQKIVLYQCVFYKYFLLYYFSKYSVLLYFIFKIVIFFELIFVKGLWSVSKFIFSMWIFCFSYTICWNNFLFPIELSCSFIKDQLTIFMYIYSGILPFSSDLFVSFRWYILILIIVALW